MSAQMVRHAHPRIKYGAGYERKEMSVQTTWEYWEGVWSCSISSRVLSFNHNQMIARVSSAIVGIPLVLAAVWAGAPWFSLLAAVAGSLGVLEFYRLAEEREARPEVVLGIGWTLFLIISGHLGGSLTMWALLGGGAAVFAWHQLGRLRRLWGAPSLGFRDAMRDYGYTAAGAIYLGWPLSLALVLRAEVQGLEWILIALLGTFATDTGAFFTGRAIGRRPLAPSISPGKTQEGAVGGFLAGVGAVMALAALLDLPLSIPESAVLGALVAVAGQVGDLVESKIKRSAGAKDAGGLIPGHGGILDRLDSVVFVIIVVYAFFVIVSL